MYTAAEDISEGKRVVNGPFPAIKGWALDNREGSAHQRWGE